MGKQVIINITICKDIDKYKNSLWKNKAKRNRNKKNKTWKIIKIIWKKKLIYFWLECLMKINRIYFGIGAGSLNGSGVSKLEPRK